MKKILLLIILVFSIFSCGNNNENTTNKVKVGLESTYAPFEYKEDGNLVGFDIDLMNELAKSIGFEVEFVEMPFDVLIPSLKAGKIDLIASGMNATDERKKNVDFSNEYYKTSNIFLRKKGNEEIKDLETLKNKKIGVQLGTIQEINAKNLEDVNVIPNESVINTLINLESGKLDAVLLDGIVANEYLKKYSNLELFMETENDEKGMALAVNKGKHSELLIKINEELNKMMEDGRYKELLNKYTLSEPKF